MASLPAHATQAFFDDLAADYHHLYVDWTAAVDRQGAALDTLLRGNLGPGPQRVWDCACGIGTQAIGLAALGHDVVGTDVGFRDINWHAPEDSGYFQPLLTARK